MSDKVLFISVFNYGVIEMAKNHLKSLWQQGLTNTHSYVTDQQSIDELTQLGYPCTLIQNSNVTSDNKDFGTTEFNSMSYLRYSVIRDLLEKGQDVWYMDVDTVAVPNNLTNFNLIYQDLKEKYKIDVWFQSDLNMMCTGCMLLFSNSKTIEFVNAVCNHKTTEANDQILVRLLLKQYPELISFGEFSHYLFPCGVLYFGDDFVNPPEYITKIKEDYMQKKTTMPTLFVHANWMVGDETKTKALKKYGLWYI